MAPHHTPRAPLSQGGPSPRPSAATSRSCPALGARLSPRPRGALQGTKPRAEVRPLAAAGIFTSASAGRGWRQGGREGGRKGGEEIPSQGPGEAGRAPGIPRSLPRGMGCPSPAEARRKPAAPQLGAPPGRGDRGYGGGAASYLRAARRAAGPGRAWLRWGKGRGDAAGYLRPPAAAAIEGEPMSRRQEPRRGSPAPSRRPPPPAPLPPPTWPRTAAAPVAPSGGRRGGQRRGGRGG